jgi:hypothetical protein
VDDRIKEWRRWLEEVISDDVYRMHLERATFERIGEIAGANPKLRETKSYFWDFLFRTYSKNQAVAVRRQADTRPHVATLGRIIHEIAAQPDLITREFWVGLWGSPENPPDEREHMKGVGEKAWDEHYGGETGDYLDPSIPGGDLAKLRHGSRRVKDYVDRNVAHLDARMVPKAGQREAKPPGAPTKKGGDLQLGEVHDGIDLVGSLFTKYGNLLTASTWVDLTPTLQHNWEAVFHFPWIEEDA